MTREEWNALIELLNRVPVTITEKLWLSELVRRELTKFQLPAKNEEKKNEN